jgi:hypothetical protein
MKKPIVGRIALILAAGGAHFPSDRFGLAAGVDRD